MKYGVVIGSHTALSVCQQNGLGIIRKSSTMGAGSTAFKAKSSTLGFFFLFDFTHSDLLANYVLRFTTTAHQSEQPLSKAEDVEKHYQAHQRHYKLPPTSYLVLFHLHKLHLKSKQHVSDTLIILGLSVSTLFSMIPHD